MAACVGFGTGRGVTPLDPLKRPPLCGVPVFCGGVCGTSCICARAGLTCNCHSWTSLKARDWHVEGSGKSEFKFEEPAKALKLQTSRQRVCVITQC
jgi:hypothetical protein